MKKRWFVIPLLVGVLALGITGGTVLAQEDGTSSDSPVGRFVSKVATILGLDEAQVQEAFDQAAREIQEESLQLKLDHLVEYGRLTQEQADEYLQWYQSRPEGLSPGFPFRGFGGHGFHRGMMRGGHGWYGEVPPPTPTHDASATSL